MGLMRWQSLADLRGLGQQPELPVIVTTSKRLCWDLHGSGCMTILHESGEPMPVELLDGLHVQLMFERCEHAAAVWRLMKAKEVSPAKCEAWCACDSQLTHCVGRCADIKSIDRFLELL